MIDLHCHILPSLDDGPLTLEDSVEMVRIAGEEGITDIAATPHVKETTYPAAVISQKINTLQDEINKKNIPVTIHPGGEIFYLHYTSLDVLKQFGLNQTRYILIEFPPTHLPTIYKSVMFHITVNGYIPIIAHPERNLSIIENPVLLYELKKKGVLIQLTAGSLTGYFGRDVQMCSEYLIQKKWVHLIGSDAHSAIYRPPVLKNAFKKVKKLAGKKWADRLFIDNPQKILNGEPLS